jgi:hypothetical protein
MSLLHEWLFRRELATALTVMPTDADCWDGG